MNCVNGKKVLTYNLDTSIDGFCIMIEMKRVLDAFAPSASLFHGDIITIDNIIEVGGLEYVSMSFDPPRMVCSAWLSHN